MFLTPLWPRAHFFMISRPYFDKPPKNNRCLRFLSDHPRTQHDPSIRNYTRLLRCGGHAKRLQSAASFRCSAFLNFSIYYSVPPYPPLTSASPPHRELGPLKIRLFPISISDQNPDFLETFFTHPGTAQCDENVGPAMFFLCLSLSEKS